MKVTWEDLTEPDHACSCECPFTGGGQGVDMGCLPSAWDMVEHFNKTKEVYSCHEHQMKIPCIGLAKFLKKNGLNWHDFKLIENG